MVLLAITIRDSGVHELLNRGRVGQGKIERPCSVDRNADVFAVQSYPETRLEGLVDHALSMDLENP